MDNDRLELVIKKYFDSQNGSQELYLNKCADYAWALNQFLGNKGKFFLVGALGPNWKASHVVLGYNNEYFDARGRYHNQQEVNQNTPVAVFNNKIDEAGQEEIEHIMRLLHPDFVSRVVAGLKKAERELR